MHVLHQLVPLVCNEFQGQLVYLQEQLERLAELRAQILEKMQSRQVKDSLLELRKYRRPPRAAAQVLTSTCHCLVHK